MSPVSCNLPSLCYRLLYLSRCQNCVCPNETIVFIQTRDFYLSRLDKCIRPDDMIKFVPMTILFAGKAALPRHPTISSWGTSLTAATTPSRPSPCSRSSRPGGPIRSAWNLPHPYTSYISHPSSFCHPWSVMLHRISYSTVQFFNSTCSSCPHPHPARYLKVEQDGPDVPCHQLLWGLHRQGYQAVLGWNRSLMDYLKQILSCWLYVLLSSCFWSITFLTLLFWHYNLVVCS